MKLFRWSHEKNERLKAGHNVSFEEIVLTIEAGGLLDVLGHCNPGKYPKQWIFIVALDAYLVPFIEEEHYSFLKTIIPSREATRDYLEQGDSNEER